MACPSEVAPGIVCAAAYTTPCGRTGHSTSPQQDEATLGIGARWLLEPLSPGSCRDPFGRVRGWEERRKGLSGPFRLLQEVKVENVPHDYPLAAGSLRWTKGDCNMWRLWIAVVLTGLSLVPEASADTVYLMDGQTVWGSEVVEQGGAVIVERAEGELRIPKTDVARIERAQMSIPPFYAAPGTEYPPSPMATAQKPAGESAISSSAPEAAPENLTAEPPPPPPIASPPPPPTLSGPWSPRY
jgi:hypothetical protein